MNNQKLKTAKLILFILFFLLFEILILGIPSIFFPFGRDQATGAYVANLWLAGKLPYIHAVEVRPPANYLPFMFVQYFWGDSELGIRILDLVLIYFSSVLVFLIGKNGISRRVGFISAILFPIFYYGYFNFWYSCQMEGWQNFFILCEIFLYLKNSKYLFSAFDFLAGFCFGISILFKFTSLPIVFLFLILILVRNRDKQSTALGKILNGVYFCLGFFVPVFITILYFYSKEALSFLKEVLYEFVILGYSKEKGVILWEEFTFSVLVVYVLWLILLIFGVISIVLKKNFSTKRFIRELFLIFWFCSMVAVIVWQGKYYFYHLLICLPPISILVSLGIRFVYRLLIGKVNRIKKVCISILILFFFYQTFYPFLVERFLDWNRFSSYYQKKISREEYYQSFKGPHDFNYQESFSVGNYIRENSLFSDTILFVGYDPVIYLSANRESASRFYSTHLIFNFSSPVRSKWTKEYFGVLLNSTSLRYIIVPHWEVDLIDQISSGIYNLETVRDGIYPVLIPKLPSQMQIQTMDTVGVRGLKFYEKTRIGKFLIFEKQTSTGF
ncbi:MAG: glycosyltransferase family 39 protein [Leptospiraceae bacterium]|nr:glycosyltransferase family 39 protein [Leptospiraceae bacterium]